jgi:hypothetical protein
MSVPSQIDEMILVKSGHAKTLKFSRRYGVVIQPTPPFLSSTATCTMAAAIRANALSSSKSVLTRCLREGTDRHRVEFTPEGQPCAFKRRLGKQSRYRTEGPRERRRHLIGIARGSSPEAGDAATQSPPQRQR